jgi:hypothetical protein
MHWQRRWLSAKRSRPGEVTRRLRKREIKIPHASAPPLSPVPLEIFPAVTSDYTSCVEDHRSNSALGL